MSGPSVQQERTSQERIRRIVRRARQEVGVRDLLTFCLARIWTVLLILGAVYSAWYASKGSQNHSPKAGIEPFGQAAK